MKKFTNFMMVAGLIILLSSCGITTKRTMWASPADSPTMEIMNTIQADVVVDKSLNRFKFLFAAAGHPNCVFKITYDQLIKITKGLEKEITE